MRQVILDIEKTVHRHAVRISRISNSELEFRPASGKWSKKEIVGHLIDSAQNNIQRFVRGQLEGNPKITYMQDEWVRLQGYQTYKKEELIQFWVLINKHLCKVLQEMDQGNYTKNCDTGKSAVELHDMSFLAQDYLNHLRHHLNQIEKELSINQVAP